jgi:hypothetical protein
MNIKFLRKKKKLELNSNKKKDKWNISYYYKQDNSKNYKNNRKICDQNKFIFYQNKKHLFQNKKHLFHILLYFSNF